jgi:hypothetical protein
MEEGKKQGRVGGMCSCKASQQGQASKQAPPSPFPEADPGRFVRPLTRVASGREETRGRRDDQRQQQ